MGKHQEQLLTQTSPASFSKQWMLIIILGCLTAFGPLSLDLYLPALPSLAGELSTTTSMAQLSLTFCLLGLAIGQLVAGPLSDVMGRRKPLIIGMILYAVTSFLCSLSPSIEVLIALRFAQGLGGSAGVVIARAVVRDMYTGKELTQFFALLMLVNGAAPIIAPIAGGQLLSVTTWQGIFIVLAAIGALMLIAVALGLKETLPPARRSPAGLGHTFAAFGRLLKNRRFMGYALTQGLVSAGMFAYISGSPFVIQEIFGASPQMFSLIFAINGAGIIIAGQLTGRLAAKIGETKLLKFGIFYAATGGIGVFIAALLEVGLLGLLIPLFMVVSSVGIVGATAFSLSMQDQGQSAGSASALLGLLSMFAGGLIMPLVGIGGSNTALPMGIIIAVVEIAAVACYYIMVHRSVK